MTAVGEATETNRGTPEPRRSLPVPSSPPSATRGEEICNEAVVSGGVRALLLLGLS